MAISGISLVPPPKNRPRRSIRCRLGWHDDVWVDKQIEANPAEDWETEPWNYECSRCGRRIWHTPLNPR